jgi:phosphoenolpyruvate carboxylase
MCLVGAVYARLRAACLLSCVSRTYTTGDYRSQLLTLEYKIKTLQSTRSTNKSIQWMVSEQGIEPSQVFEALASQNVELVFTAHPTQATRQSLLKKYSKIRSEMDKLHNTRMSKYEKIECLEEIRSQIEAAWRTDEIRRRKPTPQDESRQGLTYFHETIYNGLPFFLRRVDTALANIGQPRLPLDATPFTFGSWMGGDRDGNPFVTPQTTGDRAAYQAGRDADV